jgi:hypoxanthine phosphoribosyltransferase
VKTLIGLTDDIKGRIVIILEDIIDSGITVSHLLEDLQKYEPADLKVATLLLKPEALRTKVKPDYIGMEIPRDFIVGYGLDYDGFGRNLSDIYKILE